MIPVIQRLPPSLETHPAPDGHLPAQGAPRPMEYVSADVSDIVGRGPDGTSSPEALSFRDRLALRSEKLREHILRSGCSVDPGVSGSYQLNIDTGAVRTMHIGQEPTILIMGLSRIAKGHFLSEHPSRIRLFCLSPMALRGFPPVPCFRCVNAKIAYLFARFQDNGVTIEDVFHFPGGRQRPGPARPSGPSRRQHCQNSKNQDNWTSCKHSGAFLRLYRRGRTRHLVCRLQYIILDERGWNGIFYSFGFG